MDATHELKYKTDGFRINFPGTLDLKRPFRLRLEGFGFLPGLFCCRPSRIFYYSLNCVEWSLLPPATEEMAAQTAVVKGRFMGDPSHEYEHTELQKVNEGDKAFEEEVVVSEEEGWGGGPGPPEPGVGDKQEQRLPSLSSSVSPSWAVHRWACWELGLPLPSCHPHSSGVGPAPPGGGEEDRGSDLSKRHTALGDRGTRGQSTLGKAGLLWG